MSLCYYLVVVVDYTMGCRLHDGTLVLIGIQTHVIMLLSTNSFHYGCRLHDGTLVLIGMQTTNSCHYAIIWL